MDILLPYVLPVIAGVAVGVISGMLGIGGGTLIVPLFRLGFGMAPLASTATSLFTIIPTSIAGAISHIRNKTCHIPLGLAAGIAGAFTSPLGVLLATLSPAWAVMVATGLVIIYSAGTMLVKAIQLKKVVQVDSKIVLPALSKKQLAMGAGVGLFAGVASGYVGLGGGFIMIPFIISVLGFDMKTASGTSLLAIMILAVPGVIHQSILGNVDYITGLVVAIGSIPGAVLGANLSKVIPERALRFAFGAFLIFAAILLVVNEFV